MKKLNLKSLKLSASAILTREQLKNVLGGSGSGGGCFPTDPGFCFTTSMCDHDSVCVNHCCSESMGSGGTGPLNCGINEEFCETSRPCDPFITGYCIPINGACPKDNPNPC